MRRLDHQPERRRSHARLLVDCWDQLGRGRSRMGCLGRRMVADLAPMDRPDAAVGHIARLDLPVHTVVLRTAAAVDVVADRIARHRNLGYRAEIHLAVAGHTSSAAGSRRRKKGRAGRRNLGVVVGVLHNQTDLGHNPAVRTRLDVAHTGPGPAGRSHPGYTDRSLTWQ